MKKSYYLASAALGLTLIATPAFAQTMDYGELEETFGEPVTTSATGKPQRASDVPVAMTIISGDEIRRTGAVSLAEALKGRAGIDVNRWGAQHYDVAIRGGNTPLNPRVLVMVNGRQVYLDHFGLTSWSNLGIELSEIRQVEIVKGPMSPLFGYNAAAGVINIITYNPAYDRVSEVSAQLGVDGERVVSGVATVGLGANAGLRLSGGYAEQDEFAFDDPNAYSAIRNPHRENLAADLAFGIGEKVTGRFNYAYSNSRQFTTQLLYQPLDAKVKTHGVSAALSADTAVGALEARGYYNLLDTKLDFNLSPAAADYGIKNHVLVAQLQDLIKPTSNDTVRLLAEYRNNNLLTNPSSAGEVFYDNLAAGLTWEHSFSEALTATVAGRVDRMALGQKGTILPILNFQPGDFDTTRTEVSWNAGIVAKPTQSTTLRLQAARGIQAPSLITMGASLFTEFAPGAYALMRGSPLITPTITHGYEVGVTQTLSPLNGSLEVNGFYLDTHDVQNLIAQMPQMVLPYGMVFPQQFLNGGEYTSYGAEVALKGTVKDALRWNVDYTFTKVKEDFLPYLSPQTAPFAELTPRHKLAAGLGYTKGPFLLDVRALYRSAVTHLNTSTVATRRGDALGLDARVAVRPTDNFELFAVGENVTGSDHIDNGPIKQEARGRIGARLKF